MRKLNDNRWPHTHTHISCNSTTCIVMASTIHTYTIYLFLVQLPVYLCIVCYNGTLYSSIDRSHRYIYTYVHCAYVYVAACILILGNYPFNWGISYVHTCIHMYFMVRICNCSFLSILDQLRILTGSLISWRNYAYKNVNHCSDVRELEGGVL